MDVAAERSSRLVDAVIGPQTHLLVFDTAPEALEEHVIAPRAPAVHLDRACVLKARMRPMAVVEVDVAAADATLAATGLHGPINSIRFQLI